MNENVKKMNENGKKQSITLLYSKLENLHFENKIVAPHWVQKHKCHKHNVFLWAVHTCCTQHI